jgi:drug/metabolite transporter (DMT)-like permease
VSAAASFERRDAVDTAAVALMLLLTLSWGVNGVAVKISNTGFNPVFGSVLRSGLATLLVFGWCRYRNVPLFVRDGTLWPGLVAGTLFGTEFALIFIGLDYTSVARSALMVNTMPFWVLIGAHFVLGERMSPTKFLGLAVAFAGVAVVFSDELSLPGPEALTGDLISLAAGALWAATTLVIKCTRLSTASAEKILIYQLAVSAVIAIPLIPLAGPELLRDVTAVAAAAVLFQAAYIGTFTYILWFWLVNRYPAAGLSSFAFLTPAFGVLMGGLLLGEPLSAKLFLALGMIAAGLIIVNRPARRREV